MTCLWLHRRKLTTILALLTILVCSNFYFLSPSSKYLPVFSSGSEKTQSAGCSTQLELRPADSASNSTEKDIEDTREDDIRAQNKLLSSMDSKVNHILSLLQKDKGFVFKSPTGQDSEHAVDGTLVEKLMKKFNLLSEHLQPLMEKTKTTAPTEDANNPCPVLTLSGKPDNSPHPAKCRPHQPPKEACEYAKSMFYLDPNLQQCPQENIDLCKINVLLSSNGKYRLKIGCDFARCKQGSDIIVSIANTKEGSKIEYPFSSGEKVRESLPHLIKKTYNKGFNYVFLSCSSADTKANEIRQLISFPHFPQSAPAVKPQNKINVNIILLDSVSRAHFYRSLPRTIASLRDINTNQKIPARAFDFELYQAIHGHTAENMHALFSGHLFPSHYSNKMREESPTRVDLFFNAFKKAGYQTVYQEDLCWRSVWGMMLEFGSSSWEDLLPLVQESGVDNIGLTLASCEIYSWNKLETPFNGPDGDQICYNGKFHHTYYLEYIEQLLRAHRTQSQSAPLLTFTASQVGHDYTARRIQTADRGLSEFFYNMAHENDTLTILFSDHGNTYSSYLIESLEGRLEMYHPAMFMIVPDGVAAKLGQGVVKALELNQHRLLTLMDINNALVQLVNFTTTGRLEARGVFAPLSDNRTCDSIKLSSPNHCVCEGWDTAVKNDTQQLPFAEFAVGKLNELIQTQYSANPNSSRYGFGACRKLIVDGIENVRQRSSPDGHLITTLDVILGPIASSTQKEVFQVHVKSTTDPNSDSSKFELFSYNRISQYGLYRQCVDEGVDVKLCICDKAKERQERQSPPLSAKKWLSQIKARHRLGVSNIVALVDRCVVLLQRNHSQKLNGELYSVFVNEVANICSKYKFRVKFDGSVQNMKISTKLPLQTEVRPWEIKFLVVAFPHVTYWEFSFTPFIDVLQKISLSE